MKNNGNPPVSPSNDHPVRATMMVSDAGNHPVRATQVVSDGGWLSTGHGSYRMTEQNWRQVEAHQARRERRRLIQSGTIRTAYDMRPQLLVKVDGVWTPEIVRYG